MLDAWHQHPGLLERLDLTGPVAACLTGGGGLSLADLPPDLARRYLLDTARGIRAVEDLRALDGLLGAAGIGAVVLKGGAALTWLYEDPAWRHISDLDLLVAPEAVATARAALENEGYVWHSRPLSTTEVEWVRAQRKSTPDVRLQHPQHLTIDLHVRPAGQAPRDRLLAAICDAPGEAIWGGSLRRPTPEDFLLHEALHFMQHWAVGHLHLAGLGDMLGVLRRDGDQINWERAWESAQEWGCGDEVGTVLATLAAVWQVTIPGLPPASRALPTPELVAGVLDPDRLASVGQAAASLDNLRSLRALPTWRARGRSLLVLAFPSSDVIRHEYHLPAGHPVGLRRLSYPARKLLTLLRGLCAGQFASRSRTRV